MDRRQRKHFSRKYNIPLYKLPDNSFNGQQVGRFCPRHDKPVEMEKLRTIDDTGEVHLGRECPRCHNKVMVGNPTGAKVTGFTTK